MSYAFDARLLLTRTTIMMKAKFLAVATAGSLLVGHVCYGQPSVERAVDRFIAQRARAESAAEYLEARKELRGDVNSDGRSDLVVLYTLEGFQGGNSYAQYLAVFAGVGKTYRYQANTVVGGKLSRSVELRSIVGGKINLDTMRYRSNDPACCPSIKGKTRYSLSGGRLKESR